MKAVGQDSVTFDLTWLKWQATLFTNFSARFGCLTALRPNFETTKFWKNSKIWNQIFGNILDRLVEWLLMSFRLEGEFKSAENYFLNFGPFVSCKSPIENHLKSNDHLESRGSLVFLFLHVFTCLFKFKNICDLVRNKTYLES